MGYIADDLVACARNRVYDMCAKAARESKTDDVLGTHVLFVIYLPVQTLHSSLVGFQGDPWISAHIDEIRPTSDGTLTLDIAQGVSISKLFYGPLDDDTLGRVSEPPALPEEPAESGPATQQMPSIPGPATQQMPSISGPATQQMSSISGPATQQMPSTPGPATQQMPSIPGPATQQIPLEAGLATQDVASIAGPIAPGPATQVISRADGSTEVVTIPTQEAMSVAPSTTVHIPQTKQKRDIPRMYTQCRRLHICIQAAASRLVHLTPNKKWATKRVELLTDLIPSDPKFPIGECSCLAMK